MGKTGASLGGYRLISRVRAGGMAEVYLAESPMGARVALKRILPHFDDDPRYVEWLREEIRIGLGLRHPNVVRVLDHGEEGGHPFLVMEFVDGISLGHVRARSRVRRHTATPLPVVAALLSQAAAAIDYVHRRGIVHGDVTPANLLVSLGDRRDPRRTGAGLLKLCDFGVAWQVEDAAISRGRPLAGNPAYVAPEQAAGSQGDRGSDVFSLAVCAWELLAGRRLFARGSTEATLEMVRKAEVPRVEALRREPHLEAVLRKALARDPADRLPSARALGDAFLDWLVAHEESDLAMSLWLGALDDEQPAPNHPRPEPTHTALLDDAQAAA